jgi:hypothetical protein
MLRDHNVVECRPLATALAAYEELQLRLRHHLGRETGVGVGKRGVGGCGVWGEGWGVWGVGAAHLPTRRSRAGLRRQVRPPTHHVPYVIITLRACCASGPHGREGRREGAWRHSGRRAGGGGWGWGVGGAGCGVRGAGCGVRGAGCGVRGAGCGVRGVGCGVRGVGCGVRGVGCGVRAAAAVALRAPPLHLHSMQLSRDHMATHSHLVARPLQCDGQLYLRRLKGRGVASRYTARRAARGARGEGRGGEGARGEGVWGRGGEGRGGEGARSR